MTPPPSAAWRLEVASRATVLASACAAVFIQTWLSSDAWAGIAPVVAACGVAGLALGVYAPRFAWGAIAFVLCLYPALQPLSWVGLGATFHTPMIAAVLGVTCGTSRRLTWALPARWRLPLVLWALSIAVVWPVIALREIDFNLSLLTQGGVALSSLGVTPPVQVVFVLHVALIHLIGVLWLDALFGNFRHTPGRTFQEWVVVPFIAGAVLSGVFGVVQTVYDPEFLNWSRYGAIGRAAGLLRDGNVFAVVSALGAGASVILATVRRTPPAWMAAAGSFSILSLAVWGSASRTGLLVLVSTALAIAMALRRERATRRAILALAIAAGIGIGGAIFTGRGLAPIERIRQVTGKGTVAQILTVLWERDGYGRYAAQMIRDYPVVGVGVGLYHSLASDYSLMDRGRDMEPDNAQNWYRHQLAETGVLGSLGWLAWLIVFVPTVFTRHPSPERAIVAGGVVGVGLASLVGMPTQHLTALLALCTFLFWHELLRTPASDLPAPLRWRGWAIVWLLVAAFVVLTVQVSRNELSVPERALRAGWHHEQGFLRSAAPLPPRTRWLMENAKAVIRIRNAYLRLDVSAPSATSEDEIYVQIVRNGETVATLAPATAGAPTTIYVRAPDGQSHMEIEFRVRGARTSRPDEGSGVLIGPWRFRPAPPPGALIVD